MDMKKEMTRYAFISHMEDYMKQLLKDPLHADTDDFLKEYGIDGPKAIKILTKRVDPDDENSAVMLISKSIKDNGTDENGKRRSDSFVVKCRIPRKDYTKKMRNLYINLFESNIVDKCPINERVTSPDIDEQFKYIGISRLKPRPDKHDNYTGILIDFGKNGPGISDELLRIGKFFDRVSKKYDICFLRQSSFNNTNDIYALYAGISHMNEKDNSDIWSEIKKCVDKEDNIIFSEGMRDWNDDGIDDECFAAFFFDKNSRKFRKDIIAGKLYPYVMKKLKQSKDKWAWLCPLFFLIDMVYDCDVIGLSPQYYEACQLCLNTCEDLLKDEDFVKSHKGAVEGLKLMKIKLKKPCDYYKKMAKYAPLINEGAWGYSPMDNDQSLDFQNEMMEKDFLPDIIKKAKTIDNEWTWLGPVIFLLNSYEDTEVASSDEYKEACDLCLKGCDNLMKNEDFIKSWDDKEKIKKALEHVKKRVNELISRYEEKTSKTKSGGTTPEELNEDGESAGATSADASGQYVRPLFEKSIIRRTVYLTQEQVDYIKRKMNEEAVMDTAFGNFGFDAPIGDGKKNKENKFFKDANDHTSIMAKSWPKQ